MTTRRSGQTFIGGRMQFLALAFFIFAAGVGSSVQSIVNSELGRRTDPVSAAVVSFIGGLTVLLVVALLSGKLQLVEATKVPPLLLTGGLFGALIVTGFATTVPVLGVTEATLITSWAPSAPHLPLTGSASLAPLQFR